MRKLINFFLSLILSHFRVINAIILLLNSFYLILGINIILYISSFIALIIVGLLFQGLYEFRNSSKQDLGNYITQLLIMSLSFILLFLFLLFQPGKNFFYIVITLNIGLIVTSILLKIHYYSNYLKKPKIATLLFIVTFLLVWSISGVLDVLLEGFSLNSFSLVPLNYVTGIYDFIIIIASVTATSWFMIAMGIWLGILNGFRFVEIRKNRIRYLLMIGAYFIYSIWLPSFSPVSSNVEYIPYMWFNGLGTYGPVSSSYLLSGILGTFIVTAVLSFFFGGRQICSVTCTAPFMLQGTLMDSMKKYNRTSRLGRKTLTSRVNRAFSLSIIAIWITLLAFAVISYLNQIGVTNITIFGNDLTVFYVMLYFNFIWYIQFILMAYLGNYACVNHGICAWGSFNQFFGYLGAFKLKVKEPSLCVNCKTVDCAYACPVGITDMRASFIKKGEFKAFKCVGVGDCIEACPHDNIFIYDIRNLVREKLKKIKTDNSYRNF